MTKPAQTMDSISKTAETEKEPQPIIVSVSSVNTALANKEKQKMIAEILESIRAKNPGFVISDNLEINKITYSYH